MMALMNKWNDEAKGLKLSADILPDDSVLKSQMLWAAKALETCAAELLDAYLNGKE